KKVASFFAAGATEKSHAAHVYYQSVVDDHARYYFFADNRTAIVAYRELDLHRFIDAGGTGAAEAGWAKAWKSVQNSHFAFLADLTVLRQGSDRPEEQVPQALKGALGLLG